MNQKYMIYMYLLKARTFIALLLVIAFFSVMVPNFLTTSNLLIMTQHVAITGLLAIGMTLVILTGGIDLSVGAVAGICGMVAGALLTNGLPLWNGSVIFFNVPEVILCVALFGVLVGFVNGAVITRFGVAPFICTLGMMYVARGSALLFNDGSTYPNLNGMEALGNTGFSTLGSGTLLGIYLPIWLMIGFLLLGYWLTTKTPLGRYIYAIGGNESAARLAGVPIVKAKIFVYAFRPVLSVRRPYRRLAAANRAPDDRQYVRNGRHWRHRARRNRAGGRSRPGDRVNHWRVRHRLPRRRHGDDGGQRFLADGH